MNKIIEHYIRTKYHPKAKIISVQSWKEEKQLIHVVYKKKHRGIMSRTITTSVTIWK